MLKELAEVRERIRKALARGDAQLVVRLTQKYLDLYDQCYPHT